MRTRQKVMTLLHVNPRSVIIFPVFHNNFNSCDERSTTGNETLANVACTVIIPVEVKSSRKYSHASLDKFTRKFKSQLAAPIVLHTKDLDLTNGITYLPLYMAPCL